MQHGVGEVENEGFVGRTLVLQPVHRLLGIHVGQRAHVTGVADMLVVFVKRHHPAVIRAQRTEVIVKALGVGHARDDRSAIGNIPLANADGLVAGVAHLFGEGDFRRRHAPPFAQIRVTPGQQGRTGRPAHGLRIKTGEPRSFLGQPIHARRLVLGIAKTSQVRVTLIVGEDDEDVRPLRFRRRCCAGAEDEHGCQSDNYRHQSKGCKHPA